MIKEVIVVEGKQDIVAVSRAVEADFITTNGFSLRPHTLDAIRHAYEKRGILIFTDPDSAGERIRRFLAKRFPDAKHAFLSQEEAYANDDIGVEQASPEAILAAIRCARTSSIEVKETFTMADLVANGLSGASDAAARRNELGKRTGIGYANGKTFLHRLNHYGVTREEFDRALGEMDRRQETDNKEDSR